MCLQYKLSPHAQNSVSTEDPPVSDDIDSLRVSHLRLGFDFMGFPALDKGRYYVFLKAYKVKIIPVNNIGYLFYFCKKFIPPQGNLSLMWGWKWCLLKLPPAICTASILGRNDRVITQPWLPRSISWDSSKWDRYSWCCYQLDCPWCTPIPAVSKSLCGLWQCSHHSRKQHISLGVLGDHQQNGRMYWEHTCGSYTSRKKKKSVIEWRWYSLPWGSPPVLGHFQPRTPQGKVFREDALSLLSLGNTAGLYSEQISPDTQQ